MAQAPPRSREFPLAPAFAKIGHLRLGGIKRRPRLCKGDRGVALFEPDKGVARLDGIATAQVHLLDRGGDGRDKHESALDIARREGGAGRQVEKRAEINGSVQTKSVMSSLPVGVGVGPGLGVRGRLSAA